MIRWKSLGDAEQQIRNEAGKIFRFKCICNENFYYKLVEMTSKNCYNHVKEFRSFQQCFALFFLFCSKSCIVTLTKFHKNHFFVWPLSVDFTYPFQFISFARKNGTIEE